MSAMTTYVSPTPEYILSTYLTRLLEGYKEQRLTPTPKYVRGGTHFNYLEISLNLRSFSLEISQWLSLSLAFL